MNARGQGSMVIYLCSIAYRSSILRRIAVTLASTLKAIQKQTLLGIGANGFYFQQVTGDSGSGAVLGSNEGTDLGVGPVVTLIHKASKYNFSVLVKWLPEIYTNNRLNGDWMWVSVGLQF